MISMTEYDKITRSLLFVIYHHIMGYNLRILQIYSYNDICVLEVNTK